MTLIGMPEAAARLGYSDGDSVKRALENAGYPLVKINARAWAVEGKHVEAFKAARGTVVSPGRPKGARNKKTPKA